MAARHSNFLKENYLILLPIWRWGYKLNSGFGVLLKLN
jgi:hypothetical protein